MLISHSDVKGIFLCDIDDRRTSTTFAQEVVDIVDEITLAKSQFGLTDAQIGEAIDLPRDVVAKVRARTRSLYYHEGLRVRAWLDELNGVRPPRQIHIAGKIAAGEWIEIAQAEGGTVWCDAGGPNTYALIVNGDSMNVLVDDGGVIAIDPDDRGLDDGKVYAVRGPDGDATLKRFRSSPARLEPVSTNPAHKPHILGGPGYEVIGRLVWRRS